MTRCPQRSHGRWMDVTCIIARGDHVQQKAWHEAGTSQHDNHPAQLAFWIGSPAARCCPPFNDQHACNCMCCLSPRATWSMHHLLVPCLTASINTPRAAGECRQGDFTCEADPTIGHVFRLSRDPQPRTLNPEQPCMELLRAAHYAAMQQNRIHPDHEVLIGSEAPESFVPAHGLTPCSVQNQHAGNPCGSLCSA